MARVAWAVLCQKALQDKETGAISMIEVLEQLVFSSNDPQLDTANVATIPIHAALVVLTTRDNPDIPEPEAPIQLRVFGPKGKEIFSSEPLNGSLENHMNHRHTMRMEGIPFVENGVHHFCIYVPRGERWVKQADVPIRLLREAAAPE